MKFDCVKVTGKIDYVRSVTPKSGGYTATVSIDGAVIPKLQMTNKLYEELDVGENATLYGIFKKNRDKEKNDGVLYGVEKQNGQKFFATNLRLSVPLMLVFTAALLFCLVFVVGWAASIFPVLFIFGKENPNYMYNTTVFATVEASLVAAVILWRAWVMLGATSNPESWVAIEPATLSSRFSKFHK